MYQVLSLSFAFKFSTYASFRNCVNKVSQVTYSILEQLEWKHWTWDLHTIIACNFTVIVAIWEQKATDDYYSRGISLSLSMIAVSIELLAFKWSHRYDIFLIIHSMKVLKIEIVI